MDNFSPETGLPTADGEPFRDQGEAAVRGTDTRPWLPHALVQEPGRLCGCCLLHLQKLSAPPSIPRLVWSLNYLALHSERL